MLTGELKKLSADEPTPILYVTYMVNVDRVVERLSMLAGVRFYLWPNPKTMRLANESLAAGPDSETGDKLTLDGCLRMVASGQAYRLAADLLQGEAGVVLATTRKSFGL
jgi:hypothetical protein